MLFPIGVVLILFGLFLWEQFLFLKKSYIQKEAERKIFLEELKNLEEKIGTIKKDIENLEKEFREYFFFYELARKVSHILEKKTFIKTFSEELKYLGEIDEVSEKEPLDSENFFELKFSKGWSSLFIKTKSQRLINYLKHLEKFVDIYRERIEFYQKLQELSIYDALTEIYNRRYFMEKFIEELERSKRFNFNLSFLALDIDHFKRINDNFGHLVGDTVLREFAKLIKENIREIDFVGRTGGEEFSIILVETDKTGAIIGAERIRSKISQHIFNILNERLSITVSIGIASYPQSTIHPDVLVEIADKALYNAKKLGRNRVFWF